MIVISRLTVTNPSSLLCALRNPLPAVTTAFQSYNQNQVRSMSKHWDPKWKKHRARKVIKIDLPDYQEAEETRSLSPEDLRAKMKDRGMFPPRPWMERPFEISSTADFFEPYVPPEGDGKASYVTKEGAKQAAEMVSKKSKSWLAFRKIRTFDEDFDTKQFVEEAQKIYLDVHEGVMNKDKFALRQLVTERAYPEITFNMKFRTIHWKFLSSIEPPRIVHARCTDVVSKENVFAQVTCRFFTKQTLAVYDRFGRLAHGSEVIAKDVLEYVVFEKHVANQYGIWRVHGKIIPDWAPTNFESSLRSFRVKDPGPTPEPEPEAKAATSTT